MARSFAKASSQYLRYAGGLSGPLTFSLRAKAVSVSNSPVMMAQSHATLAYPIHELYWTTGSKLGLFVQDTIATNVSLIGTTSISTGTWYHVAGVFASGDFRAYLNGTLEGSSSSVRSVDASSELSIGSNVYAGVRGSYYDGDIAECAIWSAALTAAQITSLADGITPDQVRPDALVAYWPLGGLWGDTDDDRWSGAYDLTPTNSPTWAAHPRTIYADEPQVIIPASIAPASYPGGLLLLGVG